MTEPWDNLPIEQVDMPKLVWPEHNISYRHIRNLIDEPNTDPIHVEQLYNGALYVHDGRHRATRAFLDGKLQITAKVLRH